MLRGFFLWKKEPWPEGKNRKLSSPFKEIWRLTVKNLISEMWFFGCLVGLIKWNIIFVECIYLDFINTILYFLYLKGFRNSNFIKCWLITYDPSIFQSSNHQFTDDLSVCQQWTCWSGLYKTILSLEFSHLQHSPLSWKVRTVCTTNPTDVQPFKLSLK